MQRCITAFSIEKSFDKSLEVICQKIRSNGTAPLLIVFSSCNKSFHFFSESLHKEFPDTTILGSTSYLQFSSEGNDTNGISLMAVFSGIECKGDVLLDIGRNPLAYKQNINIALKSFSSFENMCCFELMTARSNGEELVLDTLNSVLKDKQIPVFGGTSGCCNPDKNSETFVSINGIVYENACAFVLIKNLKGRIFSFKEHLYRPTKNTFRVTDVDCESRTVYEYNGEPAALVVSKVLKTDISNVAEMLVGKPMGRVVGKEIFITEAASVNIDNSISFYSQIYNYSKITLMEMDDIPSVFNRTKREITENIQADFMFTVNCLSRTKLFEKKDLLVPFLDNLKSMAPSFIGFSGYGEQYNLMHINQTMILVLFE